MVFKLQNYFWSIVQLCHLQSNYIFMLAKPHCLLALQTFTKSINKGNIICFVRSAYTLHILVVDIAGRNENNRKPFTLLFTLLEVLIQFLYRRTILKTLCLMYANLIMLFYLLFLIIFISYLSCRLDSTSLQLRSKWQMFKITYCTRHQKIILLI